MSETKSGPRTSIAMWFYMAGFAFSVIGFYAKYVQDDTHGMIFSGFSAMLWYTCAARERDARAALEAAAPHMEGKVYPHQSGDLTIVGPECFTDGEVICYKGENYVKQAAK